jgi:hypothetical protein
MSIQILSRTLLCLVGLSFSHATLANHETNRSHSHRHSSYGPTLNTWLSAGYSLGGDELGRFATSDGSVESIRAGRGGSFSAGLIVAMDPWSSVRLSGGYQRNSLARLNGDTAFDSVQFGASVLRSHRMHEFGAGLTLHTGVSFDCNIDTDCSGQVDFDAAVGYTLEYALKVGHYYGGRRGGSGADQGLRIGVRYTGIEYQPQISGAPVDGSSLGGFVGLVF